MFLKTPQLWQAVVSTSTDKLKNNFGTSISTPSTSCAGGRHNMPAPVTLTFAVLTLKMVSESRVTWATSVPILVFLGLSILDLGPTYATAGRRQTASSLNVPA